MLIEAITEKEIKKRVWPKSLELQETAERDRIHRSLMARTSRWETVAPGKPGKPQPLTSIESQNP